MPGGDGVQECESVWYFGTYSSIRVDIPLCHHTSAQQKIDLTLEICISPLTSYLFTQVLNAGGLCDLDNIQ